MTDLPAGPLSRSDDATRPKALRDNGAGGLDPRRVERVTGLLLMLAQRLLGKASAPALGGWNGVVLTRFANILASVVAYSPIDDHVREWENALQQIVAVADGITADMRELPSSPFADERGGGLVAILVLANDPR